REQIRNASMNGNVQVIVNIATLTTGVDMPWIGCLSLARPTKSEMLLTQIWGRGLRTHPNKPDCIVLDHSMSTLDLGLPTDIHFDHLDDGTRKKSNSKREKREKSDVPQECLACGYLKSPHQRKCPDCGFEARKPSNVVHQEGDLVQISGAKLKHD